MIVKQNIITILREVQCFPPHCVDARRGHRLTLDAPKQHALCIHGESGGGHKDDYLQYGKQTWVPSVIL